MKIFKLLGKLWQGLFGFVAGWLGYSLVIVVGFFVLAFVSPMIAGFVIYMASDYMWQGIINFILGSLMFLSPWALYYAYLLYAKKKEARGESTAFLRVTSKLGDYAINTGASVIAGIAVVIIFAIILGAVYLVYKLAVILGAYILSELAGEGVWQWQLPPEKSNLLQIVISAIAGLVVMTVVCVVIYKINYLINKIVKKSRADQGKGK